MDEVGGVVQWIDYLEVIGIFVVVFDEVVFFVYDCVSWIGFVQCGDDGLFGGVIDFGYVVFGIFFVD